MSAASSSESSMSKSRIEADVRGWAAAASGEERGLETAGGSVASRGVEWAGIAAQDSQNPARLASGEARNRVRTES